MTGYLPPTLAQKLERILDFSRHRDEPRLSLQAVATMVGRALPEPVPVAVLEGVAAGTVDRLPQDVADALCDTFGIEREYLRESGGRDIDCDLRLRLWIAVRDRGLDHFAARATGNLSRDDLLHLIAQIESVADGSGPDDLTFG